MTSVNRPVVIVDPRSAGIELAPAFKARGIPTIAVTFEPLKKRKGFGTEVQNSDFVAVIPDQPGLIDILKKYNPIAVIPGADGGVTLADELAAALTPRFANDPARALHRVHKAHMQEALAEAGVPALKTLNASSEDQVRAWIRETDLDHSPLIVKPPISAGSDKVFHIPARGDWVDAFKRILAQPSNITGQPNETVVVQEQAIGTEFAVGTVSANGRHYLAHLIRYNKTSSGDRDTVFDHVEFVPFQEDLHGELFAYTKRALDALGIRWGAAHTEVMLTPQGPRLIESGARMCGGPVVRFARAATGSSQADKWVEIIVDGDVQVKDYGFKRSVVPVFLKSPATGIISNAEVFDGTATLPTLLSRFIWFENGDHVARTVDYLTSIGIVALTGARESIFADYKKIREMESKLIVST